MRGQRAPSSHRISAGKWKVAVHDNTRLYQPWEKPYFVLSAGDVYDMKARRVIEFGVGSTPPVSRQQ
jgi:hypothetical protein